VIGILEVHVLWTEQFFSSEIVSVIAWNGYPSQKFSMTNEIIFFKENNSFLTSEGELSYTVFPTHNVWIFALALKVF